MKLKAISRKQAEYILKKNGLAISDGDGRTFYATNEEETEVWEYSSKTKRDNDIQSLAEMRGNF